MNEQDRPRSTLLPPRRWPLDVSTLWILALCGLLAIMGAYACTTSPWFNAIGTDHAPIEKTSERVGRIDVPAETLQVAETIETQAIPAPSLLTSVGDPTLVRSDIPLAPEPTTAPAVQGGHEIEASRTALVPIPAPRPPELRPIRLASASPGDLAIAAPQAPGAARAPAAAVPADDRSFLEKLFGSAPTSQMGPAQVAGPGIALYNIRTKTVTLPNGERLEAHSGIGEGLDDPSKVHVRMRGPTPPGTYDLTEREQVFHGVRALRLSPVGGSAAIYGRAGILAHTFMLGPNGDSNGCISFRNYERFLQAFLKGEIQRIVVVAG